MSTSDSKIIVVGGGPVGLTAAHALHRAGIDFVLLEGRADIVEDAGSNLVLSAMGMRALAQLGLMPALSEVSTPVDRFKRFDHRGRDIGDTMFFTYFYESHGSYPRVFSRRNLIDVLWSSLPSAAQSKTYANKKVAEVVTTDSGVTVTCQDGTAYRGSMVIGADGAYSTVRKHVQEKSLAKQRKENKKITVLDEKPYLTTYCCFWVRFPVLPGIKDGDAAETHGRDATTQFFVCADSAIAAVYAKLDKPTRAPPRYGAAEQTAFLQKWAHLPLNEGGALTLQQAYDQRLQSGMINLEEGVVKNWSWGGRMVLVGDAAHKFTPSTGAGCNNGIVDVVVLCNLLNPLYAAAAGGAPPRQTLDAAFRAYQHDRYDLMTAGCSVSGNATAMATWSNFAMKFLDVHVFGNQRIQKFFINLGVGTTAKTPVFDYIEGKEEIVGKVPWVYSIPPIQA